MFGENLTISAAIVDDGFSNPVDVRFHFSSAAPLSGAARRKPNVFLARGIQHHYIFEQKNRLIRTHARTNLLEFASTINHRKQKQKKKVQRKSGERLSKQVNGVATWVACRLTSRRNAAITSRLCR